MPVDTDDLRAAIPSLYPDNLNGEIDAARMRQGQTLIADVIDEAIGKAYSDEAKAWAQSPTPPDPLDLTSKSAKTWATEAKTSADRIDLGALDDAVAATAADRAAIVPLAAQVVIDAAQVAADRVDVAANTLTAAAAKVAAEAARDATINLANAGMIPAAGGPVVAATTANITLSAPQTIDGVAVIAGNRVLVKNQTTPSQNGIYIVAAGAWTRATDMDAAADVRYTSVYVISGTIGLGKRFYTPSIVTTLETDAIAFVEVERSAWLVDFATFPARLSATAAEIAAMARVKRLELFGADTAKFYSLKFLAWKDAGTRFLVTIVSHTDADGTGATDVANYTLGSGADLWTGNREITLAAVGGSGVTGTLVIDFTDTTAMTVNNASSTTAAYQRRAIGARVIQNSVAGTAVSTALVNTAVTTNEGYKRAAKYPFADGLTATPIRNLIRKIAIYNGDKTHQYAFSVCTVETFVTPLTRFRLTIRDLTADTDVCVVVKTVASQPGWAAFVATLSSPVKLTSSTLGSDTGIYAVVEINWAAVSDFFSYGGATVALGGIHADCVFADADIADYLESDHVNEVIRCGSGETYTTLRAAVESTYSWVSGSTDISGAPICDRAHYGYRVAIHMVDDATYSATLLKVPEWVELIGNGYDRTFVARENTNPDEVLTMHLSGKMRDFSILSETAGEYCIHSDDFNRNADGGKNQNRRIRQSFKRMRLRGAFGHNNWLFGCGVSAGQVIRFDDVIGEHLDSTATLPAFGVHNTGPTVSVPSITVGVKPSLIEMRGCSSPDQLGVYLQTLEPAGISILSLTDCEFNRIEHAVASGEVAGSGQARIQWDITGRYDGAYINSDPAADSFTLEWVPSASPKRRVRNSTGSSIPKGRFVRLTGASTISLCGVGERPDGWTHAAIANGADGYMVTTRRISTVYIDAVNGSSGDFGISATGQIDYTAATKLGRTIGSIVTVW